MTPTDPLEDWKVFAKITSEAIAKSGVALDKIPDERAYVGSAGELVIYVDLPNVGRVAGAIRPEHWAWASERTRQFVHRGGAGLRDQTPALGWLGPRRRQPSLHGSSHRADDHGVSRRRLKKGEKNDKQRTLGEGAGAPTFRSLAASEGDNPATLPE